MTNTQDDLPKIALGLLTKIPHIAKPTTIMVDGTRVEVQQIREMVFDHNYPPGTLERLNGAYVKTTRHQEGGYNHLYFDRAELLKIVQRDPELQAEVKAIQNRGWSL